MLDKETIQAIRCALSIMILKSHSDKDDSIYRKARINFNNYIQQLEENIELIEYLE